MTLPICGYKPAVKMGARIDWNQIRVGWMDVEYAELSEVFWRMVIPDDDRSGDGVGRERDVYLIVCEFLILWARFSLFPLFSFYFRHLNIVRDACGPAFLALRYKDFFPSLNVMTLGYQAVHPVYF